MINTDYASHIHTKTLPTLLQHKQYFVTKEISLVRDPLRCFVQRSKTGSDLYDASCVVAMITTNSGIFRLSLNVIAKLLFFNQHQSDVSLLIHVAYGGH
jgi:hypothetical protein